MSVRPFPHQRPLAAVAAAYGLGVWAGVRFFWRPAAIGAGLALAVLAWFLLSRAGYRRVSAGMAAALFLGMLLSGLAFRPAVPAAGRYQVTGVVAQDMSVREDGKAAGYLEGVTLADENGQAALSCVYWTYIPDADAPFLPREGERVVFTGKLYIPQGRVNPYGFDFRLFLLQRGAAAGVSGAGDARVEDAPGRGLRSVLYRARNALAEWIRAVFGADSALPEALLLGQRERLPEETARSFSDAGVAHILSVSGLHVALLTGALMLPLKSWLSPKKRLVVIGAFLLAYCALLDFPAPVARASVLLMAACLHRAVRRAADPVTTLSLAFLLILLFRPLDLFSASFQLSFGAVLGIALFVPILEKRLAFLRVRALREGFSVTLAATAGTVLPTIQTFFRFSLVGLLINPLVCALFGVLLPLYAVVLLAGCLCLPLGQALAAPVNWAARLLQQGIAWVGALPLATVRVPALPWYLVAALVFAGLLATRYIALRPKRKIALAAAALTLTVFLWRLGVCRDVQYLQLAMGQADAALILDGSETTVVDAGEYGGDLAAYLLATGRRADRVILTHLHRDHCRGMLALLEEKVPVGTVCLPEGAESLATDPECLAVIAALREAGVEIRYLSAGDSLTTTRTRVTVTWPISGAVRPLGDANRYSLATLWELDGLRLLSMADVPETYEGYAALPADILKVSHHGSKNSTGEDFLRAVSPQAALITGSPGNIARLPHPDALERLARAGVSVYNTGESGAVMITVRRGVGEITAYLGEGGPP